MERKAVSGIIVPLLLISMLTLAFNIQPVNSTWPWPSPPPIEWNKTYDRWGGNAFQQTTDGGYIIAGTKGVNDYYTDVSLFKTDSYGNLQWNKTYSVDDLDDGCSVALTSDGGYILAGYTRPLGGLDSALLIKTDSYGNLQWNRTYRVGWDNYAFSIIQASDGGYIFVGTIGSNIGGSWLWLAKVDDSGNMQWYKTWNYEGYAWGRQIIQTSDDQYAVLGGASVPETGSHDFWLIKVGDSGNMLWNKTYGFSFCDNYAYSIAQTSDGGYILAGTCKETGTNYPDGWLIKTDDGGNVQWDNTYGAGGEDSINCVIQTSDGGYIFGGFFWPGYGEDAYAWFVKTDDSGELQWAGRDEDYGNVIVDIRQTSDDGYILLRGTGYPYYLISLMKLKGLAHDVAVTNVAPSKSVVGRGYSLNINVTAANQGDYTENFNVTVYANTTSIASQNVILTSGNSTTITLTWNTTGFALGNYTISAYATPVSGETDLDDNTFPDGTVKVVILGDINGDGTVDGMDLGELGMSWLVSEGGPDYVANRDINGDGICDGMDLGIMGMHWLETDP